jgi:hypothetical protein
VIQSKEADFGENFDCGIISSGVLYEQATISQ